MTGSYKIIGLDAFARALKDNMEVDHLIMLGAGASKSSGVKTAKDCIWEWKQEIYLSNNPDAAEGLDCETEEGQRQVQEWLDANGKYPPLDDTGEYSHYAEARFNDSESCRQYFEGLTVDAEPGVGYKILALFTDYGVIRIVLTTNFDGLAERAMQEIGLSPYKIALENSERIHLPMRRKDHFYVALHGDYKYGRLKNTGDELDNQEEDFKDALRMHLYNKHLIVMGYSGRDSSLMNAIEEAYLREKNGGGKLYWCSYSEEIPKEVDLLLSRVNAKGRDAKLVVAGDFDKSLEQLAKHCFRDSSEMASKLGRIVRLADDGDHDVVIEGVNVDFAPVIEPTAAIDADIARLEPTALEAAAKAVLIGAWTEDDADRDAVGGVTDEP